MSKLEQIAAEFRASLIPCVAKKIPWHEMTPDSQKSYLDATARAMSFILAAIGDTASIELAETS